MEINITYLKALLYRFVKDYYQKQDRQTNINHKKLLYEELIVFLNSNFENQINNKIQLAMLLEKIYGVHVSTKHIVKILMQLIRHSEDKSSDIYLQAEQELNEIKEKVEQEYQQLLVELEQLSKYLNENKKRKKLFIGIHYKLKNSQPLVSEEVDELSLFFDEIHLESATQVKLLEHIKIHNINCNANARTIDHREKYSLLNMLNFGFEMIDESEIDYDSRTAKEAETQYKLIEYYDIDDFIKQLSMCYSDINLLLSIVASLINKIQLDLCDQIEMIKDKDFYVDSELRKSIYRDFCKKLNAYIHLRNYYYDFENEQPIDSPADEQTLVYAVKQNGKPYILDDIEDVPDEYLATVNRLLENFKSGNISRAQISGFSDHLASFRQLKRDQVRIVLKPMTESTYCVLGIGIKKEDRARTLYNKLCSRPVVTDLAKALAAKDEIETQLDEYIRENATKGNR